MSWTQPMCNVCWTVSNPNREPVRMRAAEEERCCVCGHATEAGIYVRLDPTTGRYPTEES